MVGPAIPSIVVFKGFGPENTTEVLARLLQLDVVRSERDVAQLSGQLPLGGVGPAVVYEALGVAVISLTRGARDLLQELPAVRTVVDDRYVQYELATPDEASKVGCPTGTADYTQALIDMGVDQYKRTGSGVRLAVLDTGIDPRHLKDFSNLKDAERFGTKNQTVDDGHGHGTHCAGIAAGPLKPQIGPRFSVAPGCELFVAKVRDDLGGAQTRDIIAGLSWARSKGANIVLLAYSAPRIATYPLDPDYDMIFEGLKNDGIVAVVSAGNYSVRPTVAPVAIPACHPWALSVASYDMCRGIARDSCGEVNGDWAQLSLAAPGLGIRSTYRGGYYRLSGTSMAAAQVAGIAALYWERKGDATSVWNELRSRLLNVGPRKDVGNGYARAPPP